MFDDTEVWINFLDGTQRPLDTLIRQMIDKSAKTSLPVGLDGHTLLCDLHDVETGPDCFSCQQQGERAGPFGFSKCKIEQPQTSDYHSSVIYNQTGNVCPKYNRVEGIKCTCDAKEELI